MPQPDPIEAASGDCVFCRIVRRELPAEILYEDDTFVGILDINPIHYGHTLLIPRRHYEEFLDIPPADFRGLMQAAHRITGALVESLDLEGYNVFSNNGRVAGQSVFHFHLHIVPRFRYDNIRLVHELRSYDPGELPQWGERIRRHLSPSRS